MDIPYLDSSKNYIIGFFNILMFIMLGIILGVALIFQIKSYELNVSYTFSWRFFLYDPFATRMMVLVIFSMIVNILSAVIQFSSMYSERTESSAIVWSISSILWIILYLAVDYAFVEFAMIPVLLLVIILLVLMSNSLKRVRTKFIFFFCAIFVILIPLIGRLTDAQSLENMPERRVVNQ